jgi:hypothetical protein
VSGKGTHTGTVGQSGRPRCPNSEELWGFGAAGASPGCFVNVPVCVPVPDSLSKLSLIREDAGHVGHDAVV